MNLFTEALTGLCGRPPGRAPAESKSPEPDRPGARGRIAGVPFDPVRGPRVTRGGIRWRHRRILFPNLGVAAPGETFYCLGKLTIIRGLKRSSTGSDYPTLHACRFT